MGLLHLTCCQATTRRQQLFVVRMQAAALKQQCEALRTYVTNTADQHAAATAAAPSTPPTAGAAV
jgi:hypothetical protein